METDDCCHEYDRIGDTSLCVLVTGRCVRLGMFVDEMCWSCVCRCCVLWDTSYTRLHHHQREQVYLRSVTNSETRCHNVPSRSESCGCHVGHVGYVGRV